jgi:histidinol phosphatase-like enzyme (inositol monophosphatase family)
MNAEELTSIFPVVEQMNRRAGELIRKYFGTQLEVDRKSDRSPVTRADREAELLLREALEEHFPEHSILGEEFGETKKPGPYRWTIDPVDGTQSFLLRTPLFGTLLALERDGVPLLGSIYLPIQDHLMIGSVPTGTFLNGKRCFVSRTAGLAEAKLLLTDPTALVEGRLSRQLQSLSRSVNLVRGFGDCYGYLLVACGAADVMIDPAGVKRYDVAPLLPILEGAGGRFTSVAGAADVEAGSAVATNGLLHDQVLAVLNDENASGGVSSSDTQ